jgi:hypothetical protein
LNDHWSEKELKPTTVISLNMHPNTKNENGKPKRENHYYKMLAQFRVHKHIF